MTAYRCASCGALNRMKSKPPEGKRPVCGKCKDKLDTTGHPQEVDGAQLAKLVKSSPVPVLVDFWAPWCGPCRMASPILERLGKRYAGEMLVVKLNTDEQQMAAATHGVSALPTFAVFQGGKELDRQAGLMQEAQFRKWLAPHLAA